MTSAKSVPAHLPSVVSRKTGNEYVLVPVTGNIADMDSVFTLNETGAFIWEQIDGKRDVEEISKEVMKEFAVDEMEAQADVLDFIEEIKLFLIIRSA